MTIHEQIWGKTLSQKWNADDKAQIWQETLAEIGRDGNAKLEYPLPPKPQKRYQ